jgi:mRNA interferase HigB
LERWLALTKAARWPSLAAVRQTFSHADEVRVASGRTVVVLNIAGNNYRLITAIHYNLFKVFVMLFLTHAEYDKNAWNELL